MESRHRFEQKHSTLSGPRWGLVPDGLAKIRQTRLHGSTRLEGGRVLWIIREV